MVFYEKLENCPNCEHIFDQQEYDLQFCSADNCGWNWKNFPPQESTKSETTGTPLQTVGQRIGERYCNAIAATKLAKEVDDAVSAEREKVAAFMLSRSYATGHGDTTEDLLAELGEQIDDAVKPLVEALRQLSDGCNNMSLPYTEMYKIAQHALQPYTHGGNDDA